MIVMEQLIVLSGMTETKSEKRERIRKNRNKMVVHGRSIFNIIRIKIKKANG